MEKKERKLLTHKDLEFGQELFHLRIGANEYEPIAIQKITVHEFRKGTVVYHNTNFEYKNLYLTQPEALQAMIEYLQELQPVKEDVHITEQIGS